MASQKYKLILLAALVALPAAALLYSWTPAIASDDHDEARDLRTKGDIIPLTKLIEQAQQDGMQVIEAELEREHGQLVYELELLDAEGRVYERNYNAITGEPLNGYRED